MSDCSRSCAKCQKVWPRDPVLEVACPVCLAPIGHHCTALHPSGHRIGRGFAGLPAHGHDERDLLADRVGAYGECPRGECGSANRPDVAALASARLDSKLPPPRSRDKAQASLF